MATSPNTSRPATVTRLHVQQSVASGRRGTDGGLDREGVPRGRAPDTLPRGSEPQFPPRMTTGTLHVGSGWAAPSSVHEAFTGGGRATAAASFPCTSPSSSFILPHAGSPCGAGTAGRTQPGPCPPANETGREAWAGPRPPCPHGSWGTNRRGIPEAERDSAGRRPQASLCHRTSSAGHSSVGEGEVPPREHRVRPEEGPGLATLVPLSPLGSGGRRPAWLGPSLG